jgi:type IV secretory pathway protease TraF
MIPGYPPGIIIIGLAYGRPKVGQTVIFKHNGLEKIKRITKINDATDEVYLLGDNPSASTDSREFGWLPASVIEAKIIWPREK